MPGPSGRRVGPTPGTLGAGSVQARCWLGGSAWPDSGPMPFNRPDVSFLGPLALTGGRVPKILCKARRGHLVARVDVFRGRARWGCVGVGVGEGRWGIHRRESDFPLHPPHSILSDDALLQPLGNTLGNTLGNAWSFSVELPLVHPLADDGDSHL